LSEQNHRVDEKNVKISRNGDNLISSYDLIKQDSFEKVWFLSKGSHLVIATYNVDAADIREGWSR